jgi:pSer/pThr/pTyr-binding forkhead associated (FHA) protein
MAFLCQIHSGGSQGEHWVVGERPLVVGRGDFADACVNDDALSRSHFLIVREASAFFLVDLDSRNGTRVNGKPVSAHKLQPNQIIQAGESVFCFCLALKPGPTLPVPVSAIRNSIVAQWQPNPA